MAGSANPYTPIAIERAPLGAQSTEDTFLEYVKILPQKENRRENY